METEVLNVQTTALQQITKGEIDMQISTAKQYPRSVTEFKKEALAMATMDEETAESCFYNLTRGGKEIQGPGVRLAEICGSAWGNMRYGARVIAEEGDFIVSQGVAHDLEKNVSATIENRRRITDKFGKKYSSDMIAVTANASCSIALRNAIFKVIPKTYINDIYEAAKKVAIGDAQTLNQKRTNAIEYFAKMGVTKERILETLGKQGVEDIDLVDYEKLIGLKTAIKDGDTTIEEAFPDPNKKSPSQSLSETLKEKADSLKKPETQPDKKDSNGLFK